MSEKYKKTRKYLNYVQHLLILVSTVTGCVSVAAFASLVCVPSWLASFAVGIKICAISGWIKKYKSIIKKKKEKHHKIVLLGKHKSNTVGVLTSKASINSYISHEEFVLVNNVLRENYEMKKEIKSPWNFCETHYIKTMEAYYVICKKYTGDRNSSAKKTKQNR